MGIRPCVPPCAARAGVRVTLPPRRLTSPSAHGAPDGFQAVVRPGPDRDPRPHRTAAISPDRSAGSSRPRIARSAIASRDCRTRRASRPGDDPRSGTAAPWRRVSRPVPDEAHRREAPPSRSHLSCGSRPLHSACKPPPRHHPSRASGSSPHGVPPPCTISSSAPSFLSHRTIESATNGSSLSAPKRLHGSTNSSGRRGGGEKPCETGGMNLAGDHGDPHAGRHRTARS